MTTKEPRHPHVLVSAASKHGATAEIADHLGETLRARGIEATVAAPGAVSSVEGYDGVVLGSAVYAGHWMDDAKQLASLIARQEPPPWVWIFSSGPIGDPPKPDEDPVDATTIIEKVRPREHRVFAGKIDKSKLGFGERAIMTAVRAPEGDFRDWTEITAWADDIADQLGARSDRDDR